MGELLDKVLEIHRNQTTMDLKRFDERINEINNNIILCAEFNQTKLFIEFSTEIASGNSTIKTYKYNVSNPASIDKIKKLIREYYENEGFSVCESINKDMIIISWESCLKNDNNSETNALITEILNEDGTSMDDYPKNPLIEKWEKLYPPTRYGMPCKHIIAYSMEGIPLMNYTCVRCYEKKCPHSRSWEVPEEDKDIYNKYLEEIDEYNRLHNPSMCIKLNNLLNSNEKEEG